MIILQMESLKDLGKPDSMTTTEVVTEGICTTEGKPMFRLCKALLLLGFVLLFVAGCSQNEGSSPVALEMDFASDKSMADDSSETALDRDVSDSEFDEELMEMSVTPLDRNVLYDGDHTVSAQIFWGGNPEAFPSAGHEVKFTVYDGPNAGIMATVVTDDMGRATFTYNGAGDLGTDHIAVAARHPRTGENIFKMITVTWMNPAPILEARAVPLFVDQENHKYITITPDMVIERAEDVFGNIADLGAVSVISVSSDEPEDHIGDGSTLDDILIECPNKVMLRAERMGGEQGRVYTIHYRLTDANGTTSDDEMRIVIVKDNSDGKPVVYNRGAGYTVSPECERREIHNEF